MSWDHAVQWLRRESGYLGLASGLTVVVWLLFWWRFPEDTLSKAEYVVVFGLFYAVMGMARWLLARVSRSKRRPNAESQG